MSESPEQKRQRILHSERKHGRVPVRYRVKAWARKRVRRLRGRD